MICRSDTKRHSLLIKHPNVIPFVHTPSAGKALSRPHTSPPLPNTHSSPPLPLNQTLHITPPHHPSTSPIPAVLFIQGNTRWELITVCVLTAGKSFVTFPSQFSALKKGLQLFYVSRKLSRLVALLFFPPHHLTLTFSLTFTLSSPAAAEKVASWEEEEKKIIIRIIIQFV